MPTENGSHELSVWRDAQILVGTISVVPGISCFHYVSFMFAHQLSRRYRDVPDFPPAELNGVAHPVWLPQMDLERVVGRGEQAVALGVVSDAPGKKGQEHKNSSREKCPLFIAALTKKRSMQSEEGKRP